MVFPFQCLQVRTLGHFKAFDISTLVCIYLVWCVRDTGEPLNFFLSNGGVKV